MERIVVLDGYALNPGDLDWSIIAQNEGTRFAELLIFDRTPERLVIERARNASIIVVNKIEVTAEVIRQLPKLKMIAITATGTNNIDLVAAKNCGVLVKNVVGYSTNAVAQHVFALLLALTNKVYEHSQSVNQLEWAKSLDFCYFLEPWRELSGKTMGIYGLGNIGAKVTDIALAFGMNVLAYNRSNNPHDRNVKMVSPDVLLKESDILSLHAPLTAQTKHFINARTLSQMKPSAYLINTARGPLIQEEDLAQALKIQVIKGAGLDVLSKEPPPQNHPLVGLKNCLITPHMAWTSLEARRTLLEKTAENIRVALG
ncbi:MAG TPA: D-2-hydroxyacid dehydrogenase [Saprospiraceae bacterium]|nr:D-2-hydroxyacid dehydrogenase [Saprospiraceae bacterium]